MRNGIGQCFAIPAQHHCPRDNDSPTLNTTNTHLLKTRQCHEKVHRARLRERMLCKSGSSQQTGRAPKLCNAIFNLTLAWQRAVNHEFQSSMLLGLF
jgi:hypothetical protein